MRDRLKVIETLYKTGRLNRYDYQNALDLLFNAGAIGLHEYSVLQNEAVTDSIIGLD